MKHKHKRPLSELSKSSLQKKATKRGISLKNKSGKERTKGELLRKLRK